MVEDDGLRDRYRLLFRQGIVGGPHSHVNDPRGDSTNTDNGGEGELNPGVCFVDRSRYRGGQTAGGGIIMNQN